MTDGSTKAAKRPRLSKRVLRAWAWIAGATAFFSAWAAIGLSPKPAVSAAGTVNRPVTIVRKITRRIVITNAPKPAPVHYVYVGGGSSSSGGVSAPAPAPTTTGGSGH
jgi:hypothetical protein